MEWILAHLWLPIGAVVLVAGVGAITQFVRAMAAGKRADAVLDPSLLHLAPLHPGPCRRWFAYVAEGAHRGDQGMLELSGGELAWVDYTTRSPRWSVPVEQVQACPRPAWVSTNLTPGQELRAARMAHVVIRTPGSGDLGLVVSLTKPKGTRHTNLDRQDEARSASDLIATLRAVGVPDYAPALPNP